MVWGKRRLLDKLFVFCLLADGRRGEGRRGKERKGKQASKQASVKICIKSVQLTQGTTTSYYFLLGGIVLTTLSINQLIYLSIHPSICLSIVHAQRVLTYWLLLFLLRGRPNYIIPYHIMLHSRIYYYVTY